MRFKAKWGFAMLAAAGVATTSAVPTFAQSIDEQVVAELLNVMESMASSEGFNSTHTRHSSALNNNQIETVNLSLDAGTTYLVVAQCDSDCSDIDLWIYDDNGYEIDSDVDDDDYPVLEVTPRRSATFEIRTQMIECDVEPCYFGLGVYGR